jgi:nucleoside-diphosphate-sugar epimerase
MRIAITGATGNAGTALLRRLRAEPEVTSIVGISRRPPDITKPPYDRVEWVHVDVGDARSLPTLVDAFADVDAVVHLAWRIQPSHDEPAMRRTNVEGSRQVAAAAVTADVPHLVVASSVGAYSPGPKDAPVTEDWPTGGIRGSAYSQHKSAVERGLDAVQAEYPELIVTRVRPGLVFQAEAGSEIARYFLGPLVPVSLIGRLRPPVLPLPQQFIFQSVHADDLAEAYWLLLRGRHGGAFNAAADPVLTPNDLAQAIGARRAVPLPAAALRGLAWATWRAHLQPTDPGWIDLAANSPVMSTARLRQLGWLPSRSSREALADLVTGLSTATGTASPPMRSRQTLSDRSE